MGKHRSRKRCFSFHGMIFLLVCLLLYIPFGATDSVSRPGNDESEGSDEDNDNSISKVTVPRENTPAIPEKYWTQIKGQNKDKAKKIGVYSPKSTLTPAPKPIFDDKDNRHRIVDIASLKSNVDVQSADMVEQVNVLTSENPSHSQTCVWSDDPKYYRYGSVLVTKCFDSKEYMVIENSVREKNISSVIKAGEKLTLVKEIDPVEPSSTTQPTSKNSNKKDNIGFDSNNPSSINSNPVIPNASDDNVAPDRSHSHDIPLSVSEDPHSVSKVDNKVVDHDESENEIVDIDIPITTISAFSDFDDFEEKEIPGDVELDLRSEAEVDGDVANTEADSYAEEISSGEIIPQRKEVLQNMAAPICSAKVRGANKEMDKPDSLLLDKRESMAVSKCDAKKFVIVELCSKVLVKAVQLGNMEAHGSTPKDIRISV
eukprot:UC4_evm2s899